MVVGHIRQVVILCSVNTTKYYLDRLVSGSYGEVVVFIEVVFKTGSNVLLDDFNIVLLKCDLNKKVSDFLDNIYSTNLLPNITSTNRSTGCSQTLIKEPKLSRHIKLNHTIIGLLLQ